MSFSSKKRGNQLQQNHGCQKPASKARTRLQVEYPNKLSLKVLGELQYNCYIQMLIQKTNFADLSDSCSSIRLKPVIYGRHLESLKQKLANQQRKISNLIYCQGSQENSLKQSALKKKNKSNEIASRTRLFQAPLCSNHVRKVSDAHTILQQYFDNKHSTLLKNKSELFPTKQDSTHLQKQIEGSESSDGSREQQKVGTSKKRSQTESTYQQLKNTVSTTTSYPSVLKTMQKTQTINLGDPSCLPQPQPLKPDHAEKQLKITDFEIIKYLEEGQFGSVYLARHISTNFICALKKIPKDIFRGNPKHITQLSREIKIQSYLQHPNIVRLYSFFHDESSIYLMMEYCSGGSLFSCLRKETRMPQEKVRKYMKQICNGLEYMHSRDIIHRDIKPQNILVNYGVAKIGDFGWAINSPLLRSTHCGTPLYSPPEMILKRKYDSKVDVWNIGVMTYELLFGEVPFEIRSESDLIKIVKEDIYFSKSYPISPTAQDFVMRCLQKNPTQRDSVCRLVDHLFFQ